MNDLTTLGLHVPGDIATLTDAEHALKIIAVAGGAEELFARAKDVDGLFEAIKIKLSAMRAYVLWRDGEEKRIKARGGSRGNQHTGGKISGLQSWLPAADPGHLVAHRWRKALKDLSAFERAVDAAQERSRRICEQENLGTIRGTEGTGEFERYTPARYIEAAREVMGGIDLDPASCAYAQKTVRAATYFTAADDGLTQEWRGRVWLNPPYHRDLAPAFIAKLQDELLAGRTVEAVVLTNNVTDTEWLQAMLDACDACCFTKGRIRFEVPDGVPVSPTQGQAFSYFGPHACRFVDVFRSIGACVVPPP
jgi:hypothetical protein